MDNYSMIVETLKEYITAGLIDHDIDKVLSLATDDVMGIGMGEQGFVMGKEGMRNVMTSGVKIDGDVVYKLDFQKAEVVFHNEISASICMQIAITAILDGQLNRSGLMQSAHMRLENNQWKIASFHASPMMIDKESADAYPLRFADNTISHLKSDLQLDAFDLINKSISGGIIGIYPVDDFHLFFINDAMLTYLEYSREEFVEKFANNVIHIVHPDDIVMTKHVIEQSTMSKNDLELRIRLLKKSGDIIWVIVRGRIGRDDDSRLVYTGVFTDVTDIMELHDKLIVSEERLRIALEKTSNIIFDYDIKTGVILHPSSHGKEKDYTTQIRDAQTTLVKNGEILTEFMPRFEKALELIRNGFPNSDCVVRIQLQNGKKSWNRISLTAMNDMYDNPIRAIGMIEDITSQKEVEFAYEREVQYRNSLLADAMVCYEINLTKNRLENCTINNPMCVEVNTGEKYDDVISKISDKRIDEADRKTYLSMYSLDNVMKAYHNGETELTLEYLVHNSDGTKSFVRNVLKLIKSKHSDEIKAFMYLLDINDKKSKEIELKRKSEIDPMTGLLNKTTSTEAIIDMLSCVKDDYYGVFMIMDVDHFKTLNDTYGHPFGDKVLIKVSEVLKANLRGTDIIGRIGGDEFCVFLTCTASLSRIEAMANQICTAIRNISMPENPSAKITCSLGVTVCTNKAAKSFDKVYKEADDALYYVKKGTRDGYSLAKFEI